MFMATCFGLLDNHQQPNINTASSAASIALFDTLSFTVSVDHLLLPSNDHLFGLLDGF
jgi:hypothetical protein